MTTSSTIASKLRDAVEGRVITPDDPGYDDARTVFYGDVDRRPAAVVRVANDADVAAIVRVAREAGVELAVRSGGHSVAGHSVTESGIVLDLGERRALDIDVGGRTAWAETGLTAGEYTTAAGEHGLVTGFGDTGSVGIGGITLGGGVGFLVRTYGLTIDDLLAADVVTADGELLHVDETTHPDLFWAIRGGGGNFGVATRFRFRLHGLPGVVGGLLVLPATPEVVAGFIAEAEAAPDELTTIANVMPCPPMPMVPEDRHGELVVFAFITYAGDAEAGAKVLAPFRALATPIADLVRPITYPEMYMPEEGEYHPVAIARTMLIDELDRAAAETIVERVRAGTAMMRVAQIRVLGGAMARVPSDATAFAHRSSRLMVNVAALYERPEERAEHEAWVDGLASALKGDTASAYVNFLGDEGEARVREAYPDPTWERLVAIKRRYDPTNLFRLNQNIPPDGAAGSAYGDEGGPPMAFRGWPAEALEFFEGLEAENSKPYWERNREVYETTVRGPMEELLQELAAEWGEGRIFRPYRDIRFSADKSLYKTHIGATIGDGYVQLSADGLGLGSGMWEMAPDQLERYRAAVDDEATGPGLAGVVEAVRDAGLRVTGHEVLKTAPKGYPKDHPRIELLRCKGLITWRDWPAAAWLGTRRAKDRVEEFFRASAPLNDWLRTNVGPSEMPDRHRR